MLGSVPFRRNSAVLVGNSESSGARPVASGRAAEQIPRPYSRADEHPIHAQNRRVMGTPLQDARSFYGHFRMTHGLSNRLLTRATWITQTSERPSPHQL